MAIQETIIDFTRSTPVMDLALGQDGYFSYLEDSLADITIVPGDARMSLEEELRSRANPRIRSIGNGCLQQ